MVRAGPPELTDYQRAMAEHEHHWEPLENEPWIIEDGKAIFKFECQWQPTKTHSSEFRTVEEPIGEPCGDMHTVELECVHDDNITEIAQENVIVGSYDIVECIPPNPNRRDPGGKLVIDIGGTYAIEVTYE